MHKTIYIAGMTLVFLVLTACGGSKPSETEIHTALAEKIGQKKVAPLLFYSTHCP